jgi:hypothetical protein
VRQQPRIIELASSLASAVRPTGAPHRYYKAPRWAGCALAAISHLLHVGLGSDKEHIGGRASVMNSVSARFIGVRLKCGLADRRLITFNGSTMTATCIKRPYRQNPTDFERAPTSIGARRDLPLSCASRPSRNSGEPCSQERTRKWPN